MCNYFLIMILYGRLLEVIFTHIIPLIIYQRDKMNIWQIEASNLFPEAWKRFKCPLYLFVLPPCLNSKTTILLENQKGKENGILRHILWQTVLSNEVSWKHGLCQGRHIRSNQILLLKKSVCTSSAFQFAGHKGSVASKDGRNMVRID